MGGVRGRKESRVTVLGLSNWKDIVTLYCEREDCGWAMLEGKVRNSILNLSIWEITIAYSSNIGSWIYESRVLEKGSN